MNIGDIFRGAACYADELFVQNTGRPLLYHENLTACCKGHDACYAENAPKLVHSTTPVSLRGFYELPGETCCSAFGLDESDEMDVELGFNTTVKAVGKIPAVGDMLVDCVCGKWLVVNRRRKDDMIRGQNRLVLTVCRFQESVTTGGKDGEHHQGTVREETGVV